MDIFGFYWNPALLGPPSGGSNSTGWAIASGFSAFDTTNIGSPVLQYNSQNALQSGQEPVRRFQQVLGTFGVKYLSSAGGVVYEHSLQTLSSQGALTFFRDRDAGTLAPLTPYALDHQQTNQQVANLIVSYAMPLPFGAMPVFLGGSLKYHNGLQYQQTLLSGTYQVGSTSGYQYTRTSSSSGLGLSTDFGFFAKMTDTLHAGMMFQNITTSFNWQAQQQVLTLDPVTGRESVTSSTNVTVAAPFPYAIKLGLGAAPPDKNIVLEGEVTWSQQQARWRFGLERFYPESHLVMRFGTFADEVSNSQLWAFGGGYLSELINIDLSFVTRSLPAIQESIALGGALSATVHF